MLDGWEVLKRNVTVVVLRSLKYIERVVLLAFLVMTQAQYDNYALVISNSDRYDLVGYTKNLIYRMGRNPDIVRTHVVQSIAKRFSAFGLAKFVVTNAIANNCLLYLKTDLINIVEALHLSQEVALLIDAGHD
jgi:hypothetical protein